MRFCGDGDTGSAAANVHTKNARDGRVGAQSTECGDSRREGARYPGILFDRSLFKVPGGASVSQLRAFEHSPVQLCYAHDYVEVLLLFGKVVEPLLGFGVVTHGVEGLARMLAGALDHLLGRHGEQVGLSVYAAKLELGAVAGHEAALIVNRKDILIAELDVVVVELVYRLVCLLGVEAVPFGMERVCEELADHDVVGGQRFR